MLEGLDQVDWKRLSHAYGSAEDVPDLLRALMSPDSAVREAAIGELHGNIYHQGTVYEATAYAAPFLLELLEAPEVAGKAELLFLVHSIATGSSYLAVHGEMDHYRKERHTAAFQEQFRQEQGWASAARHAVWDGIPTYLRLLETPEIATRSMAAYLLAACEEHAETIVPILRKRIPKEQEQYPRASQLLALGQLWLQLPPACPMREAAPGEQMVLLHEEMFSQNAPLVRLAAAHSYLRLAGEPGLGAALTVFRETVPVCGDLEDLAWPPWGEGDNALSLAGQALADFPEAQIGWLLSFLHEPSPSLRSQAFFELDELCRLRRSVPALVVVDLARCVGDEDPTVRRQAARALPCLGKARFQAVPILERLCISPTDAVRAEAAAVLRNIRDRRSEYTPQARATQWRTRSSGQSVPELMAILRDRLEARSSNDQHLAAEATACLEARGAAASAAVPLLHQALEHESQWVRVFAARAVWRIERNAAAALPALLGELQCYPAGLLAAECLGEMGRLAQPALPELQRIVASELRLVELGSLDDWIELDEGFQETAQRALEQIQADL